MFVNDGLKSHDRYVRRQCYPIATGNSALSRKELVDRALRDVDVNVRKWSLLLGRGFCLPAKSIGLSLPPRIYPPIRRKAFNTIIESHATPEAAFFSFDRSVGIRRACQSLVLDDSEYILLNLIGLLWGRRIRGSRGCCAGTSRNWKLRRCFETLQTADTSFGKSPQHCGLRFEQIESRQSPRTSS